MLSALALIFTEWLLGVLLRLRALLAAPSVLMWLGVMVGLAGPRWVLTGAGVRTAFAGQRVLLPEDGGLLVETAVRTGPALGREGLLVGVREVLVAAGEVLVRLDVS